MSEPRSVRCGKTPNEVKILHTVTYESIIFYKYSSMTQKIGCSRLLLMKKEFPSSVIFSAICFDCVLSLDCQSCAGLKQCFGQEFFLPVGSWQRPSLSRHCLKENDFIS